MKKKIFIGAIALLLAHQSEAQLLNRLRQKAQQAINQTPASTDQSNSTAKASTTQSSSSPSKLDLKYNVSSFDIDPNERLCYGEYSLQMTNAASSTKVITKQKGSFYLYENGQKTGPFATAPVAQLYNWPDRGETQAFAEKTNGQAYLRSGVLTVDGKSYGNWMSIGDFYHHKAKKIFYTLGVKMEGNNVQMMLISNKGSRKVPLTALELFVSPTYETAGVKIGATQFLAKTEKEKMNFVANDDFYILGLNNVNKGPFMEVQASKSYLDNHGNFVQLSPLRDAIFVNGKEVIKLEENAGRDGKLFTHSKTGNSVWFSRGNLIFTDGTVVKETALLPTLSVENGAEVLNWISIENHKVYVFRKPL